jgi:predicted nucleic acid-binding protein
MSKMVQIRNVPDALHRKLKVRAANSGQTRDFEDAGRRGHPGGARVGVIVVDASALLEFLLQTRLGTRVEARLYRRRDELHSPHLADVEVTQGLRRLVRAGEVSPDRAAEAAIGDLADLDLHRHSHLDLLPRAWRLRQNVTAYDAMYVALAEALDAPIVTCDAPLAKAPGHRAQIEVIE